MSTTHSVGRTAPGNSPTSPLITGPLISGERARGDDDAARQMATATAFERAERTDDPVLRDQALEHVVITNLGVAQRLAAVHRDKGIPLEDLEQVAYAALVAAAKRFRADEGRDFLAFAVPTIRGELKRHFRDYGWTVRPPRRVQEIHLQVLSARDRLSKALDRPPTAGEIAEDLGEADVHVAEALRLDGCFAPSSLDLPLGSGSATLGDLLPDGEARDSQAAEARVMLAPAVRLLPERDRYVVGLRYFDGLTQQEIGDELGVTQTQVSRMLSRIIRELRDCLTPSGDALAG